MERQIPGLVIKAYCGYYLVGAEHAFYRCRTRGRLGKNQVVTGDYVNFTPHPDFTGTIVSILPRKFYLPKPPVANIDQVVLVFSACEPKLDLLMLDKFLLEVLQEDFRVIICVNKMDLTDDGFVPLRKDLLTYENMDIPVVLVSSQDGQGMSPLSDYLEGHISVFMGPSGVGKTSLLNALKGDLDLKVGEISEKIKRGKHTTRFVELVGINDTTWLVDSPGFSLVEHKLLPRDLAGYYSDFSDYTSECRFSDCLHLNEPQCGVRNAVEAGQIPAFRYDAYQLILTDLLEKERNKYR